jgi:hypothetical protein
VTHETLDQVSLAQHRQIATKLRENPEAVLRVARRNLQVNSSEFAVPGNLLCLEQTIPSENSQKTP